jgi:nitrite reductase (NADH) large subunit
LRISIPALHFIVLSSFVPEKFVQLGHFAAKTVSVSTTVVSDCRTILHPFSTRANSGLLVAQRRVRARRLLRWFQVRTFGSPHFVCHTRDGLVMITQGTHPVCETIVVIGNGMVGHRFVEKLVEYDIDHRYRLVTFCEEPRAAYDRVGLSKFFAHQDAQQLMLADPAWYTAKGVTLYVGEKAAQIDRDRKVVVSANGREIPYDHVVLATGSSPFVPPAPGINKQGVLVYRTIEDSEQMIAYGKQSKKCAVIGGGLLGLEAAKACVDMGLETHVIEFASRLMPRQLDENGSKMLLKQIEQLGVIVHLNTGTKEVLGEDRVSGLLFNDGQSLDVDMVVVSAGIRPRDELARSCGIEVGQRGGVVVNDTLQTSDPAITAIGEVALVRGMIYGLVAPGYEMADALARNFTGESKTFTGADLSTKLKLMGVDVASFGSYEQPADAARSIVFEDPVGGIYKKLVVSLCGTKLLGGMLVGDASDFMKLLSITRKGAPLDCPAGELLLGRKSGEEESADSLGDDVQVCSCNNVSKGALCAAIRDQKLCTLADVKSCTKAGTGCGGCVPMVTDLMKSEMARMGLAVNNSLCEHFAFTRQDLFQICKIKRIKTFADLLADCGQGAGCEICKPAAASIFASLWNENIQTAEHNTLQDTNDRFLANLQRGGLYSIVPRVPGGEITPDKLIVLGQVAKDHGLYTKITGGQRIDLFGAAVHQLPEIWETLVDAGFESGHAYGKALRTVKSCVGTSWCRYGIGDSVGFAIRIENRYKGLRSPHKLKSAVSGCIRECAEAQSKDFGLIATENGYNLYVCGNGGSKPRHADLLAADLDEETCIKYIDRFLMYYVQTADRLTRTSVWLDKLEGGINFLREVIIGDKLGIAAELEAQMQYVVDTYECEWKRAVKDPERAKLFRQFVNTDRTEPDIEFVYERGQPRPADWPNDTTELVQLDLGTSATAAVEVDQVAWVPAGNVSDFPPEGGACMQHGQFQVAVFNFASRGEWFATQNMCPHKREFVLSRGIVGDSSGEPKVACPLHKKCFSLKTGNCLSGEEYSIQTFPVKVEGDRVWVQLPPAETLASGPAVVQRQCVSCGV